MPSTYRSVTAGGTSGSTATTVGRSPRPTALRDTQRRDDLGGRRSVRTSLRLGSPSSSTNAMRTDFRRGGFRWSATHCRRLAPRCWRVAWCMTTCSSCTHLQPFLRKAAANDFHLLSNSQSGSRRSIASGPESRWSMSTRMASVMTHNFGGTFSVRRCGAGALAPARCERQLMFGQVDADDKLVDPHFVEMTPGETAGERMSHTASLTMDLYRPFRYTVRVVPSHEGRQRRRARTRCRSTVGIFSKICFTNCGVCKS